MMYAQTHDRIKGVDLASDSGSPNMSISVMTSISEQNESVSLDDDCPGYDAVINKRHEFFGIYYTISGVSDFSGLSFRTQLECTLPNLC